MEKKKKTTRNVNQGTPLIWRVALYFCICEYNHDQKIQINRYNIVLGTFLTGAENTQIYKYKYLEQSD